MQKRAATREVTAVFPTSEASPSAPDFRDAYERLLDEIRAVPDAHLVSLNIDILKAVKGKQRPSRR